jgi:dihydroflavonol-4-reductase
MAAAPTASRLWPATSSSAGTSRVPLQAVSEIAFVTGGVGLLGSNLVRLLSSEGFRVRALVLPRELDKVPLQFHSMPVEIVEGDMLRVDAFASSLAGVDAVFHTAAFFRDYYRGGSHWDRLYRTNVAGTRHLLAAAHRAGVRRFVHASSIAVLDGRSSPLIDETMLRDERKADEYYRSKILADREIMSFLHQHSDMWAAMVLPGWMHGPGDAGPTPAGQSVLDFMRRRLPGILPGAFPVVDARDVAWAMLSALRRGRRGERYLAAGRAMTAGEFLACLECVSGVRVPPRKIPVLLMVLAAAAGESWARLTGKPVMLGMAAMRLLHQRVEHLQFNPEKSRRELGLEFRPVETTLRDEIAWFRANGYLSQPPARKVE